jgi:3-oxoacyl-[acyl-carrier protein] reductase
MDSSKSGRTALVLGAIKGIGKAIGLDLARSGIRVALTYYDWEESLASLYDDFSAFEKDHLIIKADLTDRRQVHGLIQKVVDHFGRIDILINNIERGGWPVVHGEYTQEQWDLEMATTLRAKQWVFQDTLPYLKASDQGVVINFSSISAIVGRSGPASLVFNEGYSAANRGISLLTETWARLGAPSVRVNEIMLGLIQTRHAQETRGWGLLTDEQRAALIDHTLLGRTGGISDVVKAVRFVMDQAPYMTGSVLRLDGGYVLGGEKIVPMPKGVV